MEYSRTAPTPSADVCHNSRDVALTLSMRLIAVVKVKNILHVEAGLEMIALALAISSEVSRVAVFETYYSFPNRIAVFFLNWLRTSEMF